MTLEGLLWKEKRPFWSFCLFRQDAIVLCLRSGRINGRRCPWLNPYPWGADSRSLLSSCQVAGCAPIHWRKLPVSSPN